MNKISKMSGIISLIIELRGQRVILDSDLAVIYQVATKRLMEQVRRNKTRFPSDFMFQLTREEWNFLKSQIATSERVSIKKTKLPYVFTRNGANMVSAILKSPVAIHRSVQIMRAFSSLEEIIGRKKLRTTSPDILKQLSIHSRAIMHLFQKDRFNGKQLETVKHIQAEMINLLQQMVIASLKDDK